MEVNTTIRARATGTRPGVEETLMWLVIALIVLAIIFGGIGLFVAAAKWALIIALILLVVGAVMGFMNRRRV